MIGGALARPCISYPSIFSPGTIWERYPYLLPNLFSATAVFCGVVIGILFLEETHAEKKKRRDRGVELGSRITSWMTRSHCQTARTKKVEELSMLEGDDELPGYQTTENSPHLTSTAGPELHDHLDLDADVDSKPITVKEKPKPFTNPVILNIISYGILAL
jgi:hypothetical protein